MTDHGTPDGAVRAAVLAAGGSFIVQAPAGSGKTTLLTQRFLRLLATVERPEEIVAITFTRKAAAEMRHRLVEALQQADAGPAPRAGEAERTTWTLARAALDADARHGWQLLDQPSRLHISTIDGLNHWLARRLPLSSRLGGALELVDDAGPLYVEAARRFVERLEEASPEGRAVERLARLLDHDPARLAGLLADMLARRELWLPRLVGVNAGATLRAAMEAVLAAVVGDGLLRIATRFSGPLAAALVDALRDSARLEGALSPHAGLLASTGLPGTTADCLAHWNSIRDAVLTGGGTVRRRVDKRHGFPREARELKDRYLRLLAEMEANPAMTAALAGVGDLPPPRYEDTQWELVAALCDALVPAAAELQAVFAERGRMDHTAVAAAARWALGSEEQPTDLGLALDYRIRHLLVDEYQDTSQSQERLLQRLVAGWEPGAGHTLFCVGDPMQSIYSFREADVTLFLSAQQRGIGPVALRTQQLAANFRSAAAVVAWINETFSRLMPDEDDYERGAVRYTACAATRPDEPYAGVAVHAFVADDGSAAATHVAELVREAISEAEVIEAAEGAGARRREVAILVRSRAVLPDIVAALRAAGIAYRGVELEGLADRRAVRDLLALARALLHAGDRTAWLAVLRAPWCGLPLADLEVVAGPDRHAPIPARLAALAATDAAGLVGDSARRLTRAWEALRTAARDVGRLPLGSVVRGAWLALGGPATVEDASDLANAETVFAAFDGLAAEAGLLPAPSLLEDVLTDLKASPVGSGAARVQLMTIHKAKGLEFDTVIVPGLERRVPAGERQLLYWTTVATGPRSRELVLASTGERDDRRRADPLEAWMRRLERERGALEIGRLAYVAATRARRRLHLVGSVALAWTAGAEEPTLRLPAADSLLGFLWPAVSSHFEQAFSREQSAGAFTRHTARERPRACEGILRRLPAAYAPPAAAVAPWSPRRSLPSAAEAIRPEFDWAGRIAIAVGTVVHAALVERARPDFRESPAAAARARWRAALIAEGVPDERLAAATGRIAAAIANVAASERAGFLLDHRHREAASELALTALVDGDFVSVKIDRSFVDEEGYRWIVDWKTGSHEGGDPAAFLASELERYSAQLARYSRVMALLDERPQKIGLYFPLLDAWAEWGGAADDAAARRR